MQIDFAPVSDQLSFLQRDVVALESSEELSERLESSRASGTPLLVKAGFDPTAPDLHLGHAVLLRKLRDFQTLGHQVVFVVGDFTARIGDPSHQDQTRAEVSADSVVKNASTWQRQMFRILSSDQTSIRFNSEWLSRLSFDDVIKLCSRTDATELIARPDFQRRLQAGKSFGVHELLYPLVQAYDSVFLKVDVEVGGADQEDNLRQGRALMHAYDMPPQCTLTLPVLEGLDAYEEEDATKQPKMSKSRGNYVGLDEDSFVQFSKLMDIADPLVWRYFELLSFQSPEEIAELKAGSVSQARLLLASEIVARCHDDQAATHARTRWKDSFDADKSVRVPENTPSITLYSDDAPFPVVRALIESELAKSNSEARRLISQNQLRIDGAPVTDVGFELTLGEHSVCANQTRWMRLLIE